MIEKTVKTIVQAKGVQLEKEVRLKGLRGGNSLAIKVGTSSEPPNVLTANFMLSLKKKLNCSEAKLLTIARSLKTTGVKLEPKIHEELLRMSHSLDHFYIVEKIEFPKTYTVNKKRVETRVMGDLVYMKDVPGFVEHVLAEQGLDKENDDILVRVGLDGGQGFFKVIVSIFKANYDPEITFSIEEEPGSRLSGANRLQVLAIAEDIQEHYENLRIIVNKLQLNNIDKVTACDLKLINVLIGISSHSGKFACPYCEGDMFFQLANLRTFGDLSTWYKIYQVATNDMKRM